MTESPGLVPGLFVEGACRCLARACGRAARGRRRRSPTGVVRLEWAPPPGIRGCCGAVGLRIGWEPWFAHREAQQRNRGLAMMQGTTLADLASVYLSLAACGASVCAGSFPSL